MPSVQKLEKRQGQMTPGDWNTATKALIALSLQTERPKTQDSPKTLKKS